jgi:hypothetical protein
MFWNEGEPDVRTQFRESALQPIFHSLQTNISLTELNDSLHQEIRRVKSMLILSTILFDEFVTDSKSVYLPYSSHYECYFTFQQQFLQKFFVLALNQLHQFLHLDPAVLLSSYKEYHFQILRENLNLISRILQWYETILSSFC